MVIFINVNNKVLRVYVFLHSIYVILWNIKSYYWPNKRFEDKINYIFGFIVVLFALGFYSIIPYLIIYYDVHLSFLRFINVIK